MKLDLSEFTEIKEQVKRFAKCSQKEKLATGEIN